MTSSSVTTGLETSPVRLESLTWPAIRALQEAGEDLLVVPLGATEQHGPHLPVNIEPPFFFPEIRKWEVLGSELRKEFISLKPEEWLQYHHGVSQWEIDQHVRLF